jgi:selenocysteine-specific elongation factor
VDVPGHERFVRNMLAGAAGIDLVLLVIAADESIKPQTREHFAICRLLGIRQGIVVLTKTDLVDADGLELARLEAEEFVRGSFLEGAPVVAVSAVTGQGLEELKRAIVAVAASVAPRDAAGPLRLPIDRAFSVRGFGAVVTGTLAAGAVAAEDEVELLPGGRRLRVRGVEVHGTAAGQATAGQRTAVNLAGVEAGEVKRGMTLVTPGSLEPTTAIDTRFDLLGGALPLKHRAPVHFHAGTAEVEAEARLLEPADAMPPGTQAYVRFLLREPLALAPGDRFIVRMFSPVTTIGGGVVVDSQAPRELRRAASLARLTHLDGKSAAERLRFLAGEPRFGAAEAALAARLGSAPAEGPDVLRLDGPPAWIIPRARMDELAAALRAELERFHAAEPLKPGAPKEALRAALFGGAPAFLLDAVLQRDAGVTAEGELVRLASHRVVLKREEDAALMKMETLFHDAGLAVPATADVLAASGLAQQKARQVLDVLLRERRLVRVSAELVFHSEALGKLRALLAARKGQRFSVPEFKEWTGISRKYAIPLLEYLDRQQVTRRAGDGRVVL